MTADILRRLRDTRCDREPFTPEHKNCVCRLANEAADEIERLRQSLARKHQQYERGQRYWIEAARQALAGNTEYLRLRIDTARSGPIDIAETGRD